MAKKRNRLEIIMGILEAIYVTGEINPTKLSLKVNLSYDRVKKILDDLRARGLVEVEYSDKRPGSMTIRLTEKGLALVKELYKLKSLLEEYGLM